MFESVLLHPDKWDTLFLLLSYISMLTVRWDNKKVYLTKSQSSETESNCTHYQQTLHTLGDK